jgi:hypothetical protein
LELYTRQRFSWRVNDPHTIERLIPREKSEWDPNNEKNENIEVWEREVEKFVETTN